jgi:hypothetical protein
VARHLGRATRRASRQRSEANTRPGVPTRSSSIHQCYTHSRSHAACPRTLIDPSTGRFRNHGLFRCTMAKLFPLPPWPAPRRQQCACHRGLSANSCNGSAGSRPQGCHSWPQHHVRERAPKRTSHLACLGRSLVLALFGRVGWRSLPSSPRGCPGQCSPGLGASRLLRISNHGLELWRRAAHRSENKNLCASGCGARGAHDGPHRLVAAKQTASLALSPWPSASDVAPRWDGALRIADRQRSRCVTRRVRAV